MMERQYKDSGIEWIGKIPLDWKIGQVRHCFTRKNSKAMQEDPIILSLARSGVKIRDISTNEGQLAESYYNYNPVEPNDLLINPMDLYSGANCSISYVSGVISPAYLNLRYIGNNSPRYYDYYFKTQYWSMVFFAHGKGISFDNRWTLNADTLFRYQIPIPPTAEQQLIADYLDKKCGKIDSLIALQEQMIESLKAYMQSVITEAVTKGLNPNAKLVPSGIDWIGDIPEGWEVCRIKDLVTMKSGFNLTSEDISNEGNYPVFGGNGLRGYYDKYSNEGDYVLVGRQGALCGNINYASGRFWATDHAVVCYPKRGFAITWFGETLRSMNLGQYSLSAAQPGLSVDRIKEKQIPLPPLSEQQAIASYLDEKCADIDRLIAIKQQKIESLKNYKKSVIYEAVTGKTIIES